MERIVIKANSELGFNFPFSIILPDKVVDNPYLVAHCTTPSDFSMYCNSFDELIDVASKRRNDFSDDHFVKKEKNVCLDMDCVNPISVHFTRDLGYPSIVPHVPRILGMRTKFLGHDMLYNDFSEVRKFIESGKLKLTENDLEKFKDLPKQYLSMYLYAIKLLKNKNINVDDKIIMYGYSEGSKFASHFALLYPSIVKAVIAGGTGGTMSMPVSEVDGYDFIFPTGIADLNNFDADNFNKINFFYYMGKEDVSDPARPKFEIQFDGNGEIIADVGHNAIPPKDENGNDIFLLDKNGNYEAMFSLYSDGEVNVINKALGTKIQDRFIKQQKIYEQNGLKSVFKFYDGNHKSIYEHKDEICEDIDAFLNNEYDKIKDKVGENYYKSNNKVK